LRSQIVKSPKLVNTSDLPLPLPHFLLEIR